MCFSKRAFHNTNTFESNWLPQTLEKEWTNFFFCSHKVQFRKNKNVYELHFSPTQNKTSFLESHKGKKKSVLISYKLHYWKKKKNMNNSYVCTAFWPSKFSFLGLCEIKQHRGSFLIFPLKNYIVCYIDWEVRWEICFSRWWEIRVGEQIGNEGI